MYRIGLGYDVHAFAAGRPLIIGGVAIPYHQGLAGHSDADVLIHALCDAILGALGCGDIGVHFPDSDQQYKGIDSMVLLKQVISMMKERQYGIVNCDMVLILEKPKVRPFIEDMRSNLSSVLLVAAEMINIKATTTEKLGFEGREEGIAAQAVVLLSKICSEQDRFFR